MSSKLLRDTISELTSKSKPIRNGRRTDDDMERSQEQGITLGLRLALQDKRGKK